MLLTEFQVTMGLLVHVLGDLFTTMDTIKVIGDITFLDLDLGAVMMIELSHFIYSVR